MNKLNQWTALFKYCLFKAPITMALYTMLSHITVGLHTWGLLVLLPKDYKTDEDTN